MGILDKIKAANSEMFIPYPEEVPNETVVLTIFDTTKNAVYNTITLNYTQYADPSDLEVIKQFGNAQGPTWFCRNVLTIVAHATMYQLHPNTYKVKYPKYMEYYMPTVFKCAAEGIKKYRNDAFREMSEYEYKHMDMIWFGAAMGSCNLLGITLCSELAIAYQFRNTNESSVLIIGGLEKPTEEYMQEGVHKWMIENNFI